MKNLTRFLSLLVVVLLTSCTNDDDLPSNCQTVSSKKIDKVSTPSRFYVTFSSNRTFEVSYTKYNSLVIGQEVCGPVNFN